MTYPNELTNRAQANWPVRVNAALVSLRGPALYARNDLTSTGLTLGYFGGELDASTTVADGTVSLTNAATNYVVAHRTTGAVTAATNTTNWDNTTTYGRVGIGVAAGGVVTSWKDARLWTGGIFRASGVAVDADDVTYTADTQAWQSKKYLMRDGQWRDPLLLGSGVLTVGSITTVTDDTKYNSWPQACRLRDGRIMIAYHKGDSHNLDNLGRSVGKIATENLDGTLTWGSEFEIYDHASLAAAPYGVAQISTGRIFVSIQQYDIAVASYSAIIVYSDDDGATWSSPIDLTPTSGLTVGALCSGRVVEMRDGSLRQLVEGSASSLATRSTRIMTSTDDGLTWGSPVYVHNYTTDSVIAVEPDLLLLDDDSLLAIWRTSGSPSTHAAARSTDGGATWGAKFNIFQGWGAPRMIQASNGTLFATTRRHAGAASVVFASLDRGATWDAGTTVDATMYEQEYSSLVEMRDGRILTVYGHQPTSAYTNSDIKCAPLTEAVFTLARRGEKALTDGANIAVDALLHDNFRVTLGGNRTLDNPTNMADCQVLNFRIRQDGTGSRTLAYGSKYKFAGGAPTLSTAASTLDFISCQYSQTDDTLVCAITKAVS
jgi:hypothetical protein